MSFDNAWGRPPPPSAKFPWIEATERQRRDVAASEAARAMLECPSLDMAKAILSGLVGSGWAIASPLTRRRLDGVEAGDSLPTALAKMQPTHPESDLEPAALAMASLGVDFNAPMDGGASPMSAAARMGNADSMLAMGKAGGSALGTSGCEPSDSPMAIFLAAGPSGGGHMDYEIRRGREERARAWCWESLRGALSSGDADPATWLPSMGAAMLARSPCSSSEPWAKFWALCAEHGVDGSAELPPADQQRALAHRMRSFLDLGEPTLAMALAFRAAQGDDEPWKAAIESAAASGFAVDARSLWALCVGVEDACEGSKWSHKAIWGEDFAARMELLAPAALASCPADDAAKLRGLAARAVAALLAPSPYAHEDDCCRPPPGSEALIDPAFDFCERILDAVGHGSLDARQSHAFRREFAIRWGRACIGFGAKELLNEDDYPSSASQRGDGREADALSAPMELGMLILERWALRSERGRSLALAAHGRMGHWAKERLESLARHGLEDLALAPALKSWAGSWSRCGWDAEASALWHAMARSARERLAKLGGGPEAIAELAMAQASVEASELDAAAAKGGSSAPRLRM